MSVTCQPEKISNWNNSGLLRFFRDCVFRGSKNCMENLQKGTRKSVECIQKDRFWKLLKNYGRFSKYYLRRCQSFLWSVLNSKHARIVQTFICNKEWQNWLTKDFLFVYRNSSPIWFTSLVSSLPISCVLFFCFFLKEYNYKLTWLFIWIWRTFT